MNLKWFGLYMLGLFVFSLGINIFFEPNFSYSAGILGVLLYFYGEFHSWNNRNHWDYE